MQNVFKRFLVAIVSCLSIFELRAAESFALSEPVFQTGVPNPTQDKPQSKLWYAHGRYWVWLPVQGGSTVLERTSTGWRELRQLRTFLAELPGQADVWAGAESVRAVLVGQDRLAVAELRFDVAKDTYQPGSVRHQFALPPLASYGDVMETATIARDSRGHWWVTYDRDQKVFVVNSTDPAGQVWSVPNVIGSNTGRDDISAVFALSDRIGVLWSDQISDGVYFREHLDFQKPEHWEGVIVVEKGGNTADDHINGIVAADGTLFVATKNSVDQIGAAQQVLRIRHRDGTWENRPYALLQEKLGPSRPIVLLTGPSQDLFLLHTNYDKRDSDGRKDFIAGIGTTRQALKIDGPDRRILSAEKPLNNVTGMKKAFSPNVEVVVLASDSKGGVYEAVVPSLVDQ